MHIAWQELTERGSACCWFVLRATQLPFKTKDLEGAGKKQIAWLCVEMVSLCGVPSAACLHLDISTLASAP